MERVVCSFYYCACSHNPEGPAKWTVFPAAFTCGCIWLEEIIKPSRYLSSKILWCLFMSLNAVIGANTLSSFFPNLREITFVTIKWYLKGGEVLCSSQLQCSSLCLKEEKSYSPGCDWISIPIPSDFSFWNMIFVRRRLHLLNRFVLLYIYIEYCPNGQHYCIHSHAFSRHMEAITFKRKKVQ